DFVYRCDWPHTLDELARYARPRRRDGRYDATRSTALDTGMDDGRVRRFLREVWRKPKLSRGEGHALRNICMAATYDPDPRAPLGFRIPFNMDTGALIDARWRRWLRHDPVHMVARYAQNLRRLRGLYMDCGWRDQYHIHYGCRLLSRRLAE